MGVVGYSSEMRVAVLYFAVLKDVFGREREELELPAGATVSGLLELLRERAARATGRRSLDSIAVAVNQEYARADAVLEDGDEVALLPPVSGGCQGLRTR
jgi:molybdopterin converting factor subunit 1